MRAITRLAPIALAFAAQGSRQDAPVPAACVPTEQALRAVAHDLWAGYNGRDTNRLRLILDEQLVLIPAIGDLTTKQQLFVELATPPGTLRSNSADEFDDVHTAFVDNTAVLSFRRHWTLTHQPSGAAFRTSSRMTEVFVCRGGRWNVLTFQETILPNAERPVSQVPVARLEQYVGHYRFAPSDGGADITVTRRGSALYEAWANDTPIELLPGRSDTFFTRGISIEERFVRDGDGRVAGIVYTMGNTEIEAKRVP
jgi:Domain of unknown function (DUF4440)